MDQQPTQPQKSDDKTPKLHSMVVMQPGERVVCELKRHPIGIIMMYVSSLIAVVVLAIFMYMAVPYLASGSTSSSSGSLSAILYLGGGVLLVGLVLLLFVSTIVYWQNQWVITTDSITQINQNGLFGRQVSQLSLENLEDVTVNQTGILPHIFNYGVLKIESAGEHSKFTFPYCPNPNQCAREILDVHEKFLEERRNIQYINTNRPNVSNAN